MPFKPELRHFRQVVKRLKVRLYLYNKGLNLTFSKMLYNGFTRIFIIIFESFSTLTSLKFIIFNPSINYF